jgi:hypothetical protein
MPSTTEPPAKRRRLLTDPKIELHKWKKSSFRLATIKENSDLRTSPARAQPEFADDFDDVGNYQERSAKLYTTNKLGKQESELLLAAFFLWLYADGFEYGKLSLLHSTIRLLLEESLPGS